MNWDKDNDGNIVAAPLTSFEVTAVEDHNAVLVRFQIEMVDSGPPAIQVALDPNYALALSEDLRAAALVVLKAGGDTIAIRQ